MRSIGCVEKKFSLLITGSGRVHKFQQRISETLNLGRRESAVLCTLLLRGSQRSAKLEIAASACLRSRTWPKPKQSWTSSRSGLAAHWRPSWRASLAERSALRSPAVRGARYRIERGDHGRAAHRPVAQLEKELHELRGEFDDLKRRFEALEAQLR